MEKTNFIEITVKDHLVSHGYDDNNIEILEEVQVEKASTKSIAVDRIRSFGDKYILTTYAHGRMVYWEYEGTYEELKNKLT